MTVVPVQPITAADVSIVAATLAEAFQDDPAIGWAVPDPARRRANLVAYFKCQLRDIYLEKGASYKTEDGLAAALWAPPDRWRASVVHSLRLYLVMTRACRTRLPVAVRMVNLIEAKHKTVAEPHYYLAFIGTEPASQGKGRGSALLADMLARCDDEHVGAYLEASTVANQALYYRHGFEDVEALNWPAGGPPFWRMWRRPR